MPTEPSPEFLAKHVTSAVTLWLNRPKKLKLKKSIAVAPTQPSPPTLVPSGSTVQAKKLTKIKLVTKK